MIKKINFNEKDKELIRKKLNHIGFNSASWSDDDLADLRGRIKEFYLKEQKFTCLYCRQVHKTKNGRCWDIEHIASRHDFPQFMFEPENLCVACIDCNLAKSNKKITTSKAKINYPNRSESYLIVHPHFDEYTKNILVIKEGFYYVAIKPKGEKTIDICRLNRFYEYADFGEDVQDDERIFILSEQLKNTKEEFKKKAIRKEIAALAIQGAA